MRCTKLHSVLTISQRSLSSVPCVFLIMFEWTPSPSPIVVHLKILNLTAEHGVWGLLGHSAPGAPRCSFSLPVLAVIGSASVINCGQSRHVSTNTQLSLGNSETRSLWWVYRSTPFVTVKFHPVCFGVCLRLLGVRIHHCLIPYSTLFSSDSSATACWRYFKPRNS